MKLHLKGVLCALLAFGAVSYATEPATPALTTPQSTPYFDMNRVSVSYAYMRDLGHGLNVDDLMGGTLTLGQSFGETETSFHTWYAQTGFLRGKEPFKSWSQNGGSKFSQSIIPIVLGYTYNYKFTESLSAYAGLQAGFYYSKAHQYGDCVHGSEWYAKTAVNTSSFTPTVGLELGVAYKITKRISWDLGANFNNTFGVSKHGVDPHDTTYSKENAVTATIHTGIIITF